MTNIACASLEVLLGVLLLHAADMADYYTSSPCSSAVEAPAEGTPVGNAIFHLRQLCAAVCFVAAAIRTAMPPGGEGRRILEEAVMFISFAVAMVTRAAAGCAVVEGDGGGGRANLGTFRHHQCCPVAIAAMLTTTLCSAGVWCMCKQQHADKIGKQGQSLI